MTASALLIAPFADYGFMRRALVASFALSLGSAPIGTSARRMKP
jgi:zinc/manganese transport system permease protein